MYCYALNECVRIGYGLSELAAEMSIQAYRTPHWVHSPNATDAAFRRLFVCTLLLLHQVH